MPKQTAAENTAQYKQRLIAVVRDVNAAGKNDREAMWLLGSLAASLADKANVKTWSEIKSGLTREGYDSLLQTFQRQGNDLAKDGKQKHAYAIQALAVSLVAKTQTDAEIKQGEILLDRAINMAIAFYKSEQGRAPKPN